MIFFLFFYSKSKRTDAFEFGSLTNDAPMTEFGGQNTAYTHTKAPHTHTHNDNDNGYDE